MYPSRMYMCVGGNCIESTLNYSMMHFVSFCSIYAPPLWIL